MKPFYKWSGGKSRELKVIKEFLPKEFDTYFEPFLGGGAVWLDLAPKKSVVGDSYSEITNFFSVLKTTPVELISKIETLSKEYGEAAKKTKTKEEQAIVGKTYYYDWRDKENLDAFDQAVRFYLMRQLSFSGMLRFSKDGKFNVPYGWYKSLSKISCNQIELSTLLNTTTIVSGSWKETVASATEDDFVFLDPPYTRKFQDYHPNGKFGEEQHVELSKWFKETKAKAMIVINKDEKTTELYKPFIKHEYEKKYSIRYRDRMKDEDSNAIHFIATNYKVDFK